MASITVQPEGIPLSPDGHDADEALMKVPDEATSSTQLLVESSVFIPLVAKHFI